MIATDTMPHTQPFHRPLTPLLCVLSAIAAAIWGMGVTGAAHPFHGAASPSAMMPSLLVLASAPFLGLIRSRRMVLQSVR